MKLNNFPVRLLELQPKILSFQYTCFSRMYIFAFFTYNFMKEKYNGEVDSTFHHTYAAFYKHYPLFLICRMLVVLDCCDRNSDFTLSIAASPRPPPRPPGFIVNSFKQDGRSNVWQSECFCESSKMISNACNSPQIAHSILFAPTVIL